MADDVIELGGRRSGRTIRALQQQLEHVPMIPARKDWDTQAGEAFLRSVILERDTKGADVDALGRVLGIDDLRYIIKAREKYL